MQERGDWELLRAYVETNSQAAFGELTRRYLRLVYTTCLREVGDRTMAEDVTQAVFLLLARKASTFRSGIPLASWLFDACKYASRNALRGERRRQMREQKIALGIDVAHPGHDHDTWNVTDSCIGDALEKLTPTDRNAVLLRYVCDYTLAETGAAAGISEEAARKRVNRALVKLRATLMRSGAALTAATVAEMVQAHHAQAAPGGLEAKIAHLALTHASTPLAGPITQIAQGAQTTMTFAKVKTITAFTIGLLAAGGGVYLAAKTPHPTHPAPAHSVNTDTHAEALSLYFQMNMAYANLQSCSFTETAAGSYVMGMPYQMQYAAGQPKKFNILITRNGASQRILYQDSKVWTIPQDTPSQAKERAPLQNYTPLMDCLIGAANVKQPFPEMMLDTTPADITKALQNEKAKTMFTLGEPAVIDGVLTDTVIAAEAKTTFSIGHSDHLLRRVINEDISGHHPELNYTINYSNTQINPTLPADTFTFTPPT